MGSNKQTVWETNLGSFVEDEATVLVHQGKDRTEQWMMVRLQSAVKTQAGQQGKAGQSQVVPSPTD